MARRVATHLARARLQFALLAGLLAIAAVAAFITLANSSAPTAAQQQPTYTRYKAVDTGQLYSCAIKEVDGKIDCWGNVPFNDNPSQPGSFPSPTDGGYVKLSVESRHGCAIKTNGTAKCWGEVFDLNSADYFDTANKKYRAIDIHYDHACGVVRDDSTPANDGQMICKFGIFFNPPATPIDTYGKAVVPPDYQFKDVTTGRNHTCGLVRDNNTANGTPDEGIDTVTCWGSPSESPSGTFKSINDSYDATCGIRTDDTVECWGNVPSGKNISKHKFKSIGGGLGFVCGVVSDSNTDTPDIKDDEDRIICWGADHTGQSTPPVATYKNFDSTYGHSCAIAIDSDPETTGNQGEGSVVCWGLDTKSSTPPSSQPTPAVTPTPTLTPTPGVDTVSALSTRSIILNYTCILTGAGEAKCFGVDRAGRVKQVPQYTSGSRYRFSSLATGYFGVCAISYYDRTQFCWGQPTSSSPENVSFKSLAGGIWTHCGIVLDSDTTTLGNQNEDSIQCWGTREPADPIWDTPSGKFSDVVIGWNEYFDTSAVKFVRHENACALYSEDDPNNAAGTIACWGNNEYFGDPPANMIFKSVDSNGGNGCGVILDGDTTMSGTQDEDKVKCWGRNTGSGDTLEDFYFSGQNIATFKSISVEQGLACGIVLDADASAAGNQNEDSVKCKTSDARKIRKGYIATGTSIEASTVGFTHVDVGSWYVCGITKKHELDCYGSNFHQQAPGQDPNNDDSPVRPPTAASISELPPACNTDYELVTPLQGGRYPATGGDFYVLVAPAAINGTALGVRMYEDTPITVSGRVNMYYELSRERYAIEAVDSGCNALSNQVLVRPADVCVPMPSDITPAKARLFQIGEDDSIKVLQPARFTDIDGNLCAEAFELPITLAVGEQVSRPLTPSELTATAEPTVTPTPVSGQWISRIKPSITKITLSAEDRVRLLVNVYGVQDILDNSLADDVTFEWSVEPSGGAFEEADHTADADASVDERETIFTAPSSPGRYTVKVWLDRYECRDDDNDDGCTAEFEVTVRRAAAPPTPTVAPVNPDGEIPSIIADSDGNQYEVFTPEDGGNFDGDDTSVSADPAVIPNGEIIGIRVEANGLASNAGQTYHRITLDGLYYDVYAVDGTGTRLDSYLLNNPVTVCIPLPSRIASRIAESAMVSLKDDGTFAVLSSRVRLTADGTVLCGAISELSARVAAAHIGSPEALPSPTPMLPVVEDPDTGGTTPPISTSGLILLIILGSALGILSLTLLKNRKAGASP